MVQVAAPVLETWTNLGEDLKTFMTGIVLVIMFLASVAAAWAVTRSVVKAGAAALGGAIVLGIIASQTVLTKGTAEQIEKSEKSMGVVQVDDTVGGGGLGVGGRW